MPRPSAACCKRCTTYIAMASFFLAGGIEYSVIFPTMLDYVKEFGGKEWLYGLSLSAFSISNLLFSPIYGLLFDKIKMTRLIVLIGCLFEVGGNFMYFAAYSAKSTYLILGSRFIVGLGAGAGATIFAELAQTTNNKLRTTIFSVFMAMRQFGLIIGPAFNIFLQETNFYIGPFPVNPLSSPGLFMIVLWIIVGTLFIFMFSYLPRIDQDTVQNKSDPKSVSKDDVVNIKSGEPSLNTTVTSANPTGSATSPPEIRLGSGESSLHVSQDNLTKSTKDMLLYSQSVSVQNSKPGVDNRREDTHLLIGPSSTGGSTGKPPVYGSTSSRSNNEHASVNNRNLNPDNYVSFPGTSGDPVSSVIKGEEGGVMARVKAAFNHVVYLTKEIIQEEYVVVLTIILVTMFNQAAIEAMFVPLAENLLHWNEKDISYFFAGSGVEVISSFVVVSLLSRKLKDRWQMLMGLVCEILAYSWLLGLVGNATDKTPWIMWRFIIGGILLLWGLPAVMVTSASLYSKLLPMKIQGFGQGVRRSVFSIGAILGPLWAGGAVTFGDNYFVLLGVPCALLLFVVTLLLLSFKRLKEPAPNPPTQSAQDKV